MPTESMQGCDIQQPSVMERRVGEAIGKSSLSKQRYVELVQLGKIASEELIKHGLQRHEYCEFGTIMQKIMQLE